MSKFDVSCDLYFVEKDGKKMIHFCGDSFYGAYSIEAFGELLCELFQRYLDLCHIQLMEISHGKDN